MSTEVAELLETTADLLEKHGHTRREMFTPQGAMCVEGGFLAAAYLLENGEELDTNLVLQAGLPKLSDSILSRVRKARRVVASVLVLDEDDDVVFVDDRSLVSWNDDSAKDSQEVLDKLRLAAKKALT